MNPSAFNVPIWVFSLAVMRCMVVTMVSMAIARNRTGRIAPMVFPSFTSPIASDQEMFSSFERTSMVFPSAASAAFTNDSFGRSERTLIW